MTVNDATVYAEALFMAALEADSEQAVYTDVNSVVKAIQNAPEYIKLIDTPALDKAKKHGLIECAFRDVHELTVNLMKLLSDKSRFYCFEKIAHCYGKLYDAHNNILRGEVISARALTSAQMSTLTQKLCDQYGKRVVLTNTVDPDILGGLRLDIADTLIDGSLRSRLCNIEKILKNTVI